MDSGYLRDPYECGIEPSGLMFWRYSVWCIVSRRVVEYLGTWVVIWFHMNVPPVAGVAGGLKRPGAVCSGISSAPRDFL